MAVVLPAFNEEKNLTPLITELVDVARRDALALPVEARIDLFGPGTPPESVSTNLEARIT